MEANWQQYSSGVQAIRTDAQLSEDERLDQAEQLYEGARATHEELVQELEAERAERLQSIDRELFGAPGNDGHVNLKSDEVLAARQNGFREALIRLSGADEAQLSETVEMAGLTGDATLLRAARVVAQHKGLGAVVQASVLKYGTDRERARFTERAIMPSDANLGVIARSFAPFGVNLAALTPDLAARRRAEQEDQAREIRRLRGVGRR